MGWLVLLPAPLTTHEIIQVLSSSDLQNVRRGSLALEPSDRLHNS
jgi:hypothetical protein